MEFKYPVGQNQRAPSPTPHPFSTAAYMNSNISEPSLQGCDFVSSGFPGNASTSTVLPTLLPVNVDESFRRELERDHIRRELEKEKIRREIFASEMTLARRRELEEEVMREMESERALGISMQRLDRILVPEGTSMPFNPMNRYNNKFGGLQSQVDMRQPYTGYASTNYAPTTYASTTYAQTYNDQVIQLAKPDGDDYGAKRKVAVVYDNEHPPCNVQKKSKHDWSCALCQVDATSEKQLNDHLQGKKHKAKLRSIPE